MSESTPHREMKYADERRYLVDISSLRLLVLGTPLSFAALFLGSLANGPREPTAFHALMASIFAVPFATFLLIRIIKAGYLVLDPRHNKIVVSGDSIDFGRLGSPRVGVREVEFMSTQWHPMRGSDEGLEIAPGRIILFGAGHSRRRLQHIADVLAGMLDEFHQREAEKAASREVR